MTGGGALTFFNPHEAATVEAMAARIIPGTPEDPGAREAGVIVYIDRALAGAYRDLQPLYRRGVQELDARARSRFGRPFAELGEPEQDRMLGELLEVTAPTLDTPGVDEATALLPYFAAVVHQHTVEGMFGDPAYGGNRDAVGWKLIGFPGARWGYSAEQMRYGFDARRLRVMTLEDLRRDRGRGEAERGDGGDAE
ncbi:MAG TPA: gluconate 2-dehydrogenase subunit 3 family protein [Candidatus Dormibacteraeota bacterium]|jgi:gluconate 2-dehydrogenase gamma chain|nr:gluconate 2-dehydrogenase subunit 3 family protein [Candidatus Dormibacteraeota bacterium]